MSTTAKLQENIHVVIRFRPTNKREKKESKKLKIKDKPIIFQNNDEKRIGAIEIRPIKNNEPMRFTFDHILDDNTSQESAFNYIAEQTCNEVLAGYNGCIFAYGQTGSGKTYTMFGPEDNEGDPRLMGIIPRSTSYIFSEIEDDPHIIEAKVKVSFVEIYKEKLRDLLNPSSKKQLKIRLNKQHETEIIGVAETPVMSLIDVLKLIDCANQHRTKAATSMNQSSSRSHMLMVLTVACKVNDSSVRVGKLNLVDLAGSEKVRKTNAKGNRLKEAQKINLSLTVLGQVISALSEKRKHIPFRDSKLTHVLKDSLGGNCKTTIVINASKHMFNRDETIISLRFGSRCKMITNEVKVNKVYSNNELLVMINQLRSENTQLKLDLQNATSITGTESIPRSTSYSISESSTFADMDVGSNKLFDKKNKKNEKFQEKIQELENKINELEEENNDLKSENIELKEDNNKVIECDKCVEYENKTKEYQGKDKELIEFKNNMNDLNDKNEELQLEIKSLRHENKEYKIKLEDIRKQQHMKTETLNAELAKFKEISEDQSGVTNELMNEINKLKQSTINSEAIISAQDKQLKTHQEEMNEFEKTIMDKNKIILHYETDIKNMREKLNEFEQIINNLNADHDIIISDKNDEINEMNEEINTKDDEINAKDDEIEQLKSELENRTQQLMDENHKLAQQIADNINIEKMEIVSEENIIRDENNEKKDELMFDETYSFTFTTRPIGITFEHTPDKKNIRVTGVENDSAAKGNVFVESTVYKFQDEVVENIGAKYVYKAYKKRYANVLPLTITFRKSDGYYDGYKEGDGGDNHNEQVSVEQIVQTATRLSGIHKKPLISANDMKQMDKMDEMDENDDIPTTDLIMRQTSVFDSAEYLNKVEVERKIRRQTIIENQNGPLVHKVNVNNLGPVTDTRNRFSLFKKMKTPMDLLGEKNKIKNDISKKEKELTSIRKMSLPNNPGKRMNILINMATIEDDITILKRKLENVNKNINKKNKKNKNKDVDVDVAIYQEAIYGNKQPMMNLQKAKSISKVTSITGLDSHADIILQFSETVYPDFEDDDDDDDDDDDKEESESQSHKELIDEVVVKLKHGVQIKDRKYLFSTYQRCFIGKEAVAFMVKDNMCKTRQEAVNLGKMLLAGNLIRCVGKHKDFKDEKLFYRFLSDQKHIEI